MYSPHMGQAPTLAQLAQAEQDAQVQQALDTMYLITGAPPPSTASTDSAYTLPEVTTTATQSPWLLLALIVGYAAIAKAGGSKLWR